MRARLLAFGVVGIACGGTVVATTIDASDDVANRGDASTDQAVIDADRIDARAACLALLGEVDYARACRPDSAVACNTDAGAAFGNALFECILDECAHESGFSTCGTPTFTFDDAGCFNGSGGCCSNGWSDYDAYVAWDDCASAALEGPQWLCVAGGKVEYSGCLPEAD